MKKIIKPLFLLSTVAMLAACNSSKGVSVDFCTAKARASEIVTLEASEIFKNSFTYEITSLYEENVKDYRVEEEKMTATIKFDAAKHMSSIDFEQLFNLDYAANDDNDIKEETKGKTYFYWDSEDGIIALSEHDEVKSKTYIASNISLMSFASSSQMDFYDAINMVLVIIANSFDLSILDSQLFYGAAYILDLCPSEEVFLGNMDEYSAEYAISENPGDLSVNIEGKGGLTGTEPGTYSGNATMKLKSNTVNYMLKNFLMESEIDGKYNVDATTSKDVTGIQSDKVVGKKGAKITLPKDLDSYKPVLS